MSISGEPYKLVPNVLIHKIASSSIASIIIYLRKEDGAHPVDGPEAAGSPHALPELK
jgi:hypothetical protein